jgi:hypothetical protein
MTPERLAARNIQKRETKSQAPDLLESIRKGMSLRKVKPSHSKPQERSSGLTKESLSKALNKMVPSKKTGETSKDPDADWDV